MFFKKRPFTTYKKTAAMAGSATVSWCAIRHIIQHELFFSKMLVSCEYSSFWSYVFSHTFFIFPSPTHFSFFLSTISNILLLSARFPF